MFGLQFARLARPLLNLAIILGASLAGLTAPEATAEPNWHTASRPAPVSPMLAPPDVGAADRLAAADRLRTLSQELQAAACALHAGIDPKAGRAALIQARREFAHVLNALEFGNPAMGIAGAEQRSSTLRKLHDMRAIWTLMREEVSALIAAGPDSEAFARVLRFEGLLHRTSGALFAEVAGQYANPFELLQADMHLIDIAGRQALLTQEIATYACRLALAPQSAETVEALKAALSQATLGAEALHIGLPALGIPPAPTHEIARQLSDLREEMSTLSERLAEITRGSAAPRDVTSVIRALATRAEAVNEIVRLYTAHAERVL